MQILVTGVGGLIGSHLADELLSQGHTVIGIDNFSFGNRNNIKHLNDRFYFYEHDISKEFPKLFIDVDVVFHLAAYKKAPKDSIDSSDVMLTNVNMIKNVIDYVQDRDIPLIFTSTSDVYGNSENFLEDESVTIGPPNVERYSYAMSKLFDEQLLLNLVNENKIKCIIPRIFGCFSERSNKGWSGGHVPLFIDKAMKGEDIIIHGDGKQTRSMCYVSDIIDGLIKILENRDNLNGEILNIGSSEEMSVVDCAKLIIKLCNSKSKIRFIDEKDIFGNYKEIRRRSANTDKMKKLTNYIQKTSFVEKLKKVINHVK